MDFIQSSVFRRLLMTVLGGALVVLNKKLNLGLDSTDTTELVGLVVAYVLGSNLKEAHIAGKEASAKVVTIGDAKAVFDEPAVKP